MRDGRQMPVAILGLEKGEPVKQKAQQENKQGPFEYFSQYGAIAHGGELLPGKAHGVAYGKKKRGEYQVGGRAAIPMRMTQRGKGEGLAARGVHDDHKTNGHSSEDVQGQGS